MVFCGKSDVGMRRQINQDSFRCISIWGGEATLLVVCDGMGGHKAGEVASRNAVELFCSEIVASPCFAETPEAILDFVRRLMVTAASKANTVTRHLAHEYEEYSGMGTTLVAALVYRGYLYSINVGDSRLYIVTKYDAYQVTKDHSFVQYLLDNGKLTPEEAQNYPQKNVITRAIGVADKLEVDFFYAPLAPWEHGYLLLCSDGLTNYADNQILVDILHGSMARSRQNPEAELGKKAEMLIAYANAKGGSDNITAVLAQF